MHIEPSNIAELLELEKLDNFEMVGHDSRALHRPDIAPLAYEVQVLGSAFGSLIQENITDFLEGANQTLFEKLYRNCNGIFIGATKFAVFGFQVDRPFIHVPWDIEVPNALERGEKDSPSLIVGASTETKSGCADTNFYHSIQKEHEIHVTQNNLLGNVVRQYTTLESWLSAEVARALQNRDQW